MAKIKLKDGNVVEVRVFARAGSLILHKGYNAESTQDSRMWTITVEKCGGALLASMCVSFRRAKEILKILSNSGVCWEALRPGVKDLVWEQAKEALEPYLGL
jgi:hypothetical protein